MTNEMEYIMHLYACGAKGEIASPPGKSVDWNRIVYLAENQGITYTVAMAIKKSETDCPEDVKNKMIAMLRGGAIKNIIKREGILKLVNKMESEGIDVIIIKGFDVSRYYANPECRVSSDTDLLINILDETKAVELLKKEGFSVKPRRRTDNHAVATHPGLGMVELHVKLLPDVFNLEIFDTLQLENKAINDRVEINFYDLPYYGLCADDSIAFLTYHMMKHLMFSGISLRMIMDIALYFKSNIRNIDKEEYVKLLRKTHYYYTMQLIFGISIKYYGFCENDFPIKPLFDNEEISAIMTDLEEGGWQGFNEKDERFDFWNYYLQKRKLQSKEMKKSICCRLKDNVLFDLSIIFLPMKMLQEKYPILKRYPIMYLFCSFHRIIFKGTKQVQKGGLISKQFFMEESVLSEESKKRLAMFKKLEIM